jgi:predicted Rdx family selenoprotein
MFDVDILLFKESYLSVELVGNFGTKVLEIFSIPYPGGVLDYKLKGSFISLQAGYKFPLNWFLKRSKKKEFSNQEYQ